MDSHSQQYQAASLKALRPLVGKRIRGLIKDREGFFGLEMEDRTQVWILCDPEGNGPGFAEITKP